LYDGLYSGKCREEWRKEEREEGIFQKQEKPADSGELLLQYYYT